MELFFLTILPLCFYPVIPLVLASTKLYRIELKPAISTKDVEKRESQRGVSHKH